MNIFKQSTQFKNWSFTPEQLDTMQIKKFERGLAIIAELNKNIHQDNSNNQKTPHQKISVNIKSKNCYI